MEKLKEVIKNLTIKCVQLTEQGRKQSDTIDRLQERASDLGRLERHLGREQVQPIVDGQRN